MARKFNAVEQANRLIGRHALLMEAVLGHLQTPDSKQDYTAFKQTLDTVSVISAPIMGMPMPGITPVSIPPAEYAQHLEAGAAIVRKLIPEAAKFGQSEASLKDLAAGLDDLIAVENPGRNRIIIHR